MIRQAVQKQRTRQYTKQSDEGDRVEHTNRDYITAKG